MNPGWCQSSPDLFVDDINRNYIVGGVTMKKALITMAAMFLVMVWPLGGLWKTILNPIIGGGVEQSFLYPLYVGLIILAGIIVGCTDLIMKEIRSKGKDK